MKRKLTGMDEIFHSFFLCLSLSSFSSSFHLEKRRGIERKRLSQRVGEKFQVPIVFSFGERRKLIIHSFSSFILSPFVFIHLNLLSFLFFFHLFSLPLSLSLSRSIRFLLNKLFEKEEVESENDLNEFYSSQERKRGRKRKEKYDEEYERKERS